MTLKIILVSIFCVMPLAPVAQAQTDTGSGAKVLGKVVNGNTTIEFDAASKADLDTKRLKAWSDFASADPKVAGAVGHDPALLSNDAYVKKQADLAKLFSDNPGMRDAMIANPGNFVVPTSKAGE